MGYKGKIKEIGEGKIKATYNVTIRSKSYDKGRSGTADARFVLKEKLKGKKVTEKQIGAWVKRCQKATKKKREYQYWNKNGWVTKTELKVRK